MLYNVYYILSLFLFCIVPPYISFSLLFSSCRGPSSVKTLNVAELVAEVHNCPLEHNLQP